MTEPTTPAEFRRGLAEKLGGLPPVDHNGRTVAQPSPEPVTTAAPPDLNAALTAAGVPAPTIAAIGALRAAGVPDAVIADLDVGKFLEDGEVNTLAVARTATAFRTPAPGMRPNRSQGATGTSTTRPITAAPSGTDPLSRIRSLAADAEEALLHDPTVRR
jgi:hypothetical protein